MNNYEMAEKIIQAVSLVTGCRVAEIKGPDKSRHIAAIRDVAVFLVRRRTNFSYPALAGFFSNRNHSTLIVCVRREQARLDANLYRKDGRTQSQWHDDILLEANKPIVIKVEVTKNARV